MAICEGTALETLLLRCPTRSRPGTAALDFVPVEEEEAVRRSLSPRPLVPTATTWSSAPLLGRCRPAKMLPTGLMLLEHCCSSSARRPHLTLLPQSLVRPSLPHPAATRRPYLPLLQQLLAWPSLTHLGNVGSLPKGLILESLYTHVPCWSLPRKGTIVCHVPSSFRTCIVGTLIDLTTVVALAFAFGAAFVVTALFATAKRPLGTALGAAALDAASDFTNTIITVRASSQFSQSQSHLTGSIASKHLGQGLHHKVLVLGI